MQSYEFDLENRLKVHTLPDKTTISYEYDAEGYRLSVQSQEKAPRRYEYDELNRVVKEIDPSGNAKTYEYDGVGRLVGTTDRNGNAVQYEYDGAGQRTKETWLSQDGSPVATYSTTYGNADQVLKEVGPAYEFTYTYNQRGQKTSITAESRGVHQSYTHTFEYYSRGNLTKVTDNDGIEVTSLYDERDMLVQRAFSNPVSGNSLSVEFFHNERGEQTCSLYHYEKDGSRP